jgi:hypothetical protein
VVDVIGVVCLIVFFVVEGPFGVLNDVANAYLLYPIWCLRLARTWAKPQTLDERPSPAR